MKSQQIAIKGSRRQAVPFAKRIGSADAEQKIKISIYARRNPNPPPALKARLAALNTALPTDRQYFTNEEYNAVFGAVPAELEVIAAWATENKLAVVEKNVAQRRVSIEGTIQDISGAFNVQIDEYEHPELGRFRGRVGKVYVPEGLYHIVEGVFGLDTRPVGKSHLVNMASMAPWEEFITHSQNAGKTQAGTLTNIWPGTFFPTQVAGLYDYPSAADGAGQNVAIFAFNGDGSNGNGGYSLPALTTYFQNVLGQKVPEITDVVIQGRGNVPGPDTQASDRNGDSTGEVMLDMCVVGAVAPAAKIFMYFTEFSSQGWVDALHNAIAAATIFR